MAKEYVPPKGLQLGSMWINFILAFIMLFIGIKSCNLGISADNSAKKTDSLSLVSFEFTKNQAKQDTRIHNMDSLIALMIQQKIATDAELLELKRLYIESHISSKILSQSYKFASNKGAQDSSDRMKEARGNLSALCRVIINELSDYCNRKYTDDQVIMPDFYDKSEATFSSVLSLLKSGLSNKTFEYRPKLKGYWNTFIRIML